MPYKRTPTDDEVEALAVELRPLWRKDDAVRPWLRKHAAMLTALVHDDWSWAGIASALGQAGITYRTGHPWHGEQLRTQIAIALRPLKYANSPVAKLCELPPDVHGGDAHFTETPPSIISADLRIPISGRRPDQYSQLNDREQTAPSSQAPEPRFKPAVAKPYAPPIQPTAEERAEIDANRKRILGY